MVSFWVLSIRMQQYSLFWSHKFLTPSFSSCTNLSNSPSSLSTVSDYRSQCYCNHQGRHSDLTCVTWTSLFLVCWSCPTMKSFIHRLFFCTCLKSLYWAWFMNRLAIKWSGVFHPSVNRQKRSEWREGHWTLEL